MDTCQVIVNLKPDTPCGHPAMTSAKISVDGLPAQHLPLCEAHAQMWSEEHPNLRVFAPLNPPPDYEPLGVNCDNACMLPWTHPEDRRSCHYHARLDAWVTRGPDGPLDQRCLRDHPSVNLLMRRK